MTGKHFNRKFVNEIIGTLKKNGFECTHSKNGNRYIIGKKGGVFKKWDSGVSCKHPLRRWLKSEYDFDLTEY